MRALPDSAPHRALGSRVRAPRLLASALVAVALLASACTGSNAVQNSPDSTYQFTSGTGLGQVIPAADRHQAGQFTGALLDGGTTSLAAAKGKVVVVNFWASWCGPCRTETPQFDTLYRQLRTKGVDFLGIDTKDVKGNAQAFIKTNDISYPIVYDQLGETAIRLGKLPQSALPFTVLIDPQGRVAGAYVIRLSPIDLTRSIDKLLAER